MILKYNGEKIDDLTVEDWKDLHDTMVDFSNRVATRYRARIANAVEKLCHEIEELPASEQQTRVSLLAAEIRQRLV